MPPPIPPITKEDLLMAVSSLTRAALSYRSVLFIVADANPDVFPLILKHEDLLNLADRIINTWRKQLGHDEEDEESSA
jgi:hypothetical protein